MPRAAPRVPSTFPNKVGSAITAKAARYGFPEFLRSTPAKSWSGRVHKAARDVPRKKVLGLTPVIPQARHKGPRKPKINRCMKPILPPCLFTISMAFLILFDSLFQIKFW